MILRIPLLALIVICFGCNNAVKDQIAQKKAERDQEGLAAVSTFIDEYAGKMFGYLPDKGTDTLPDGSVAMLQWRLVVAELHYERNAALVGERWSGSAAELVAMDGVRILEAARDYWMGRSIRPDRAVARIETTGRVDVHMAEFAEQLEEFGKLDAANPWRKVVAFEALLPYWQPVWRFVASKGGGPYRNDVPFMGGVFELPPLDGQVEEAYHAFRDRICAEKLDGGCKKVLYEHRDKLMMLGYLDRLQLRLDAYRKNYGDWVAIQGVADRLELSLKEARALTEIPGEYPVLPDTLADSWLGSGSQLVMGSQGSRFVSRSSKHDISVDLMGSEHTLSLNPSRAAVLAKEVRRQMGDMGGEYVPEHYSGELYFLLDKSIKVRALTAMGAPNLSHAMLVGRRRADGTRMMADLVLAADREGMKPIVHHGDQRWRCRSIAGLGDEWRRPDRIGAVLSVGAGEMRIGPPPVDLGRGEPVPVPDDEPPPEEEPIGDPEVPADPIVPVEVRPIAAKLTGDPGKVGMVKGEVARQVEHVIIGIHGDERYDVLHSVLNRVVLPLKRRPDILIAICEDAPEELEPNEPSGRVHPPKVKP